MPTAFVLLNCDLGSEQQVIAELKSLPEVVEICGIYGVYDMIIKLQADTLEKLKELISWKIRRTDKIKSTLTLIEIEEKDKAGGGERGAGSAKGKWIDSYGRERIASTSNAS